ncbi:MAG: AmmeMemoRadiSam system protein B [Chloroflexi bacterium]|nr:AmmeMemoRadiSam system protein B [Chloroflexota bacterium]
MTSGSGGSDDTTPLPRLRAAVDAARVPPQHGDDLVCLYDRDDPAGAQVVMSQGGLLLASLLDGRRSASAVQAVFALRTGQTLPSEDLTAFVDRLDQALLLESTRYQLHHRRIAEAFRRGPTRPAVHAGGAYPGHPDDLRDFLGRQYVREGGPGGHPGPVTKGPRRGLLVPHIDLHRGGHSYAWAYRELAESVPADLYVLLGTCHMPMRRPFAATRLPYDTPFGPVTADRAALDRLAAIAPFDIYEDELSHRREHALEFQAVYLKYLEHTGAGAPAEVVSILCVPPSKLPDGGVPGDDPATDEFLQALQGVLQVDGRRVCFVAGADFAHVGPQFGDPSPVDARFADHVRAGDLAMLDLIAAGDADGFYRQVVQEPAGPGMANESAAVGGPRRICGLAPTYAMLRLVERDNGQILHYDQWIDEGGAGSVTFGSVIFD